MLIAGKRIKGEQNIPVLNPYDNSIIGEVPVADEKIINEAVTVCEDGFKRFSKMAAHQRSEILYLTGQTIGSIAREELTDLIIKEAGKPYKYARAEVERAKWTFIAASEEAKRLTGETLPMDASPFGEKRKGFFIRVPIGIIAAITPFNFPLNLVAHKIAPALAAGNSVVLKPASKTPFTALKLAEILFQAGLPEDVLSIVTGPGNTTGKILLQNKKIRMVSFTGSAEVGEEIKRLSGIKKVTLELGSNSGVIVDEDCDLLSAIEKCLYGAFVYSGQVCIHTQRIYLHKNIASQFTEKFLERVKRLKIGNPDEIDTDIGPMIDDNSVKRALDWLSEAVASGAKILIGAKAQGRLFEPTVVNNTRPDMKIVCEENFAPIVSLETFNDFSEAIVKYNEGSRLGRYDYGLSAGVFTNKIRNAFQAVEELEVGQVHINDSATFRVDHMPYGGVKDSGVGREGPRFAIEEMTEIKLVTFYL